VLGADYHELLIGFGDSGFVVIYREEINSVVIVAVRHQKEEHLLWI
jgi:plasmid stabilization system protein ParE